MTYYYVTMVYRIRYNILVTLKNLFICGFHHILAIYNPIFANFSYFGLIWGSKREIWYPGDPVFSFCKMLCTLKCPNHFWDVIYIQFAWLSWHILTISGILLPNYGHLDHFRGQNAPFGAIWEKSVYFSHLWDDIRSVVFCIIIWCMVAVLNTNIRELAAIISIFAHDCLWPLTR